MGRLPNSFGTLFHGEKGIENDELVVEPTPFEKYYGSSNWNIFRR